MCCRPLSPAAELRHKARFRQTQQRIQQPGVHRQLDDVFQKPAGGKNEGVAVHDVQPKRRQAQIQHQHCRQAGAECARQRHPAAVEPAAVNKAQKKLIQYKAEEKVSVWPQKLPEDVNDDAGQPGQPWPV